VYLRPHLSRALSLFRPDLFHSSCIPLCVPPPLPPCLPRSTSVLRSSRSHSRCSFSSLSRSRDLSSLRSHSRSYHPAFCHGVPPLTLFFSRTFFFPQHAPESSSDFYNLLLVAPYTTGRYHRCCRHRRVSGAAHPEKPENRGKQKRPARRAAHPAGWVRSNGSGGSGGSTGIRWGRSLRVARGNAGATAGVADEKRKRHRGTPTQRIIRASACMRLSRARGS